MFATVVDEVRSLDNGDVTARLRELELQHRRIDAEMAAVVSVAAARGVHRDDGHLSVAGWLRANLNWSGPVISAMKKAVRLLDDHAVVGDALLGGHIGSAQVDELARARSNRRCGSEIGEVLDTLLDVAEQLAFDDFRRVVRRWESLADEDGAAADAEANEQNRTTSLNEVNGAIDLRASGGSAMTASEMRCVEGDLPPGGVHPGRCTRTTTRRQHPRRSAHPRDPVGPAPSDPVPRRPDSGRPRTHPLRNRWRHPGAA